MDDASIGRDVRLNRVIVDEGVAIPDGFEIGVDLEKDSKRFVVTDSGLVVVSQGVVFD